MRLIFMGTPLESVAATDFTLSRPSLPPDQGIPGKGRAVDCTGADVRLTPWQGEANGHIVLLAGKGMPLRKAIQSALAWYAPLLSLDA